MLLCASFSLSFYFWLHSVSFVAHRLFLANHGLSLFALREGYSPVVVHGFFIVMASLVAEQGL